MTRAVWVGQERVWVGHGLLGLIARTASDTHDMRTKLTADEEMAVGDGRSERVLRLAHVLALVLREHLDDDERALAAPDVHVDLEVLSGTHRLTVEVPRDGRSRDAAEEDAQHGAVAVGHRLVAQRQREPRRLLLAVPGGRRHARRSDSGQRGRRSGRCCRLLELDGYLVAGCGRLRRWNRYWRHRLFAQRWHNQPTTTMHSLSTSFRTASFSFWGATGMPNDALTCP